MWQTKTTLGLHIEYSKAFVTKGSTYPDSTKATTTLVAAQVGDMKEHVEANYVQLLAHVIYNKLLE